MDDGGVASGGFRELVPCIATTSVAIGVNGIFMECLFKKDRGYLSKMDRGYRGNEAKQLHTTRSWNLLVLEVNGSVPEASLWTKVRFGEDIIIAPMDTGVYPESKSFDDEGMWSVPSRWKGSCPDITKYGVRSHRLMTWRRSAIITRRTDFFDGERPWFGTSIHGHFTELGVVYAIYHSEKLMEHIKLFSNRLNIPKLIQVCDEQQHWKELTYLYIQYDEFDNAATTIMNHSSDTWDHMQFKDVATKAADVELYYKAVHFYLQEHPDLINDFLHVLALCVDHTRVVDIM